MTQSKIQLKRKLILALRIDRGSNVTHTGIPDGRVRYPEVRMIHQVEGLRAELHPKSLREIEISNDPNVEVHEAGTPQDIPARVPEANTGRNSKGCGIKPVCGAALVRRQVAVGNPVRAGRGAGSRSEEHTSELQS